MQNEERWYSINGRITRLTWVTRVLGAAVTMVVLIGMITAVMPHDRFGEHAGGLSRVPAFGLIIAFLIFRFMQDIKRLHDLGKPGPYMLCAFIPLVNLIYMGFIIFGDGQPHTNEFGVDPKGRGSDIDDVADVFR